MTNLISIYLYIHLALGQSIIPQKSDYVALQSALKTFVTTTNAPDIMRMSLNDVQNYNPGRWVDGSSFAFNGGGNGCIFKPSVQAYDVNRGLSTTANQLKAFVKEKFPNIAFPDGDIVSLAGKVAIDKRLNGCYKVRWSFGRKPCVESQEKNQGMSPLIKASTGFSPFLKRYSMSLGDMAVVILGSHGYFQNGGHTVQEPNLPSFKFIAKAQPIKQYLLDIINNPTAWKVYSKTHFNYGQNWYSTSTTSSVARFPIDMAFFPSTLTTSLTKDPPGQDYLNLIDASPEMKQVESTLISQYASNIYGNVNFHQKFTQLYAQMLELGSDPKSLTPFEDGGSCAGSLAQLADVVASTNFS